MFGVFADSIGGGAFVRLIEHQRCDGADWENDSVEPTDMSMIVPGNTIALLSLVADAAIG